MRLRWSLTVRHEATLARIEAGLTAPCAPLVDVTPQSLFDAHGDAIHQLLEPLWTFQEGVIRDLLARADATSTSTPPARASLRHR